MHSRVTPARLLCGFLPLLFAAIEQHVAVFGQYPTLSHQVIYRAPIALHVRFAAQVAFRDGLARVAGFLAFRDGLWERYVGSLEGKALVGSADRWIAKVPARIGSER